MWAFCCEPHNDLFALLSRAGAACQRLDTPGDAVRAAPEGGAVLILADRYPATRTDVGADVWRLASRKRLRLYVEYPGALPGSDPGPERQTAWERLVVASRRFEPELAPGAILSLPDCRYVAAHADRPWLVAARVAGYDTAVFGLPGESAPVLFELPEAPVLVATTRLSGFVTGRYSPQAAWSVVWRAILAWLNPAASPVSPEWKLRVRPSYGPDETLPPGVERRALGRAAEWVGRSGLLLSPGMADDVRRALQSGVETAPPPGPEASRGDGSLGVLEGYASGIRYDGSQMQRLPVRADCQAETAMVLAVDAAVRGRGTGADTAWKLLSFLYGGSGLHGGRRGDPRHPAFGLIAWGAWSPAWEVANYGDDNARALLATALAAACLGTDAWDEPMLRALLANLRTTGRLGFRGDRIDIPDLERRGWRAFAEADTYNPAPHYEAYLWAGYLWAFRQTGFRPFLAAAESGIRLTMEAYPAGWRFNDTSERAQMLLPLAWLVRTEENGERLAWLRRVAGDLLAIQDRCGAFPERFHSQNAGYYRIPRSNDDYGVTETPLIQSNGDPASDQLYTSGFALLGLHEAAAATGDQRIAEAANRLAGYLCRIQARSGDIPYLDGAWFRAFDFRRWEYWSSSADAGWGAWCVEAGWGMAWTAAVLGLRHMKTSLWDLTAGSRIAVRMGAVQARMALNDGLPPAT